MRLRGPCQGPDQVSSDYASLSPCAATFNQRIHVQRCRFALCPLCVSQEGALRDEERGKVVGLSDGSFFSENGVLAESSNSFLSPSSEFKVLSGILYRAAVGPRDSRVSMR